MQALRVRLTRKERADAAKLFVEMRATGFGELEQGIVRSRLTQSLRSFALSGEQLFTLGLALEDAAEYELAAEVLRAVTVNNPNAAEAETALLKVITLFVHRLDRREEAHILVRLFLDRYPQSSFRGLAEELRRAATA